MLSQFLEMTLLYHPFLFSLPCLGSLGPLLDHSGVPALTLWAEGGEGLKVEALEDWLGEGCWSNQFTLMTGGSSAPWPGPLPQWPGGNPGGRWGPGRDASQQPLDPVSALGLLTLRDSVSPGSPLLE